MKYTDPLDMPIFSEPVTLGFDPEFPKEEPELWEGMWSDDIARSIFLAIGRWYLRSQYFLPGCIRIAEMIRFKPPVDVLEMLSAFSKFGGDPSLSNLFPVAFNVGSSWGFRENPRYKEQRIQRELRLRELLLICQDRRHVEWKVKLPKMPEPETVEVISGIELQGA